MIVFSFPFQIEIHIVKIKDSDKQMRNLYENIEHYTEVNSTIGNLARRRSDFIPANRAQLSDAAQNQFLSAFVSITN